MVEAASLLPLDCTASGMVLHESRVYPERMRVDDPTVFAFLAQVIVCALSAAIASASLNLPVALVTGAGKGWSLRVVKVVEYHHAAVLGPSKGIKLIVIPLAERQELLQGKA